MDIVKIEGLEKFKGAFHFGPFDLRVEAGAILMVQGRPESGKTTLFRLLWGLECPDKGRIEVFGKQPHREPVAIRSLAGYVSQLIWYYPELTTEAFLEFISGFYPKWDQQYALDVLRQLGVTNWHEIRDVSEGGCRMMGIAAALGHHPELLLLDQPAAGLDEKARRNLIAFLRRLAREERVTIVVSSHMGDDLDEIGDGKVWMNQGRVMEETC